MKMKYAAFILVVVIQGIQCQNCTRTNNKNDTCAKPCDPTHNNPCRGSRTCKCDGDCGYSCVKSNCPTPLVIDHGQVRYTNRNFGSLARYRCDPPYKLEGPRKRTCRGNGKWDGKKPVCKGKCTDPGNVQHGKRLENGFEFGKKVKYACSPGFTMKGSSTLTCTETGSWNRVKPNCICERTNKKAFRYCKKSCDPQRRECKGSNECVCDGDCGYSCVQKGLRCDRPVEIQNGRRQYTSIRFSSTVKYQCNKPYSLLGDETRTCRGIRKWDGIDPECKILCEDPEDIQFANKQIFRRNNDEDYVTVGDSVVYNCYPSYKMNGSNQLFCNKNGKWSGSKPTCTVPTCDPPQVPANAEFMRSQKGKTSYKYTESVVFGCKTGYFSRGIGLRTCKSKGWEGPSFSCSPKSCGDPGSPLNGDKKSYVFTFKSKVYFKCKHGYKLVGDEFRQCQSNGKWSGRTPTCKQIDCGVLPTPDKAEKVLETHTKVDGVVGFKCKEKGYEMRGSEIRTCLNTGLWSGFTTSCKIISCGDPGTPNNGKQINVKNNYNYGGTVEFECDDNYTLGGSRTITCEETKDWSSAPPKCWAPCRNLGEPRNGNRIGEDFRHGKSVSFSCHRGFELNGDAKTTCMDGTWSGNEPHCQVINCGNPGTPRNGKQINVKNSYNFGGTVEFACNDNYMLVGSRKITCKETKHWSSARPNCLAPCSDPGVLSDGSRIGDDFRHNKNVSYKCNKGFKLEGDTTVTCSNGTWRGIIAQCKAPCSNLGEPDNGVRVGNNFLHGGSVSFECLSGFELKGDTRITCSDGTWSGSIPQCKVCREGKPLGMSNRAIIPDKSIRASSERDNHHRAHHGRLGGNSFWCSTANKDNYIEIDLPKEYKITKATIDVQESNNAGSIVILTRILEMWFDIYYETTPLGLGKRKIVVSQPFISKNIRIQVYQKSKRAASSVCLKAEVYGCKVIPRGCILPGTAVRTKVDGKCVSGRAGKIHGSNNFEFVYQSDKIKFVNINDVELHEKTDACELTTPTPEFCPLK